MKRIPNVIGYNTDTPAGIRRMMDALQPYLDDEDVSAHMKDLKRLHRHLLTEREEDEVLQETEELAI